MRSLFKCLKLIYYADSLDDLEKAAKMFADAVTQFGVDVIIGLLTRGAGKMRAKANAKPDGASGGASTAPRSRADIEAENKAKADGAKKGEINETNTTNVKTNKEIREWYNNEVSNIPELDKQWKKQGLNAEERAQKAYDIRHKARLKARDMMQNKDEVSLLQKRDIKKYGNPDGPTFDQLVDEKQKGGLFGDDVYEEIIGSSNRTDPAYNKKFGVKGD